MILWPLTFAPGLPFHVLQNANVFHHKPVEIALCERYTPRKSEENQLNRYGRLETAPDLKCKWSSLAFSGRQRRIINWRENDLPITIAAFFSKSKRLIKRQSLGGLLGLSKDHNRRARNRILHYSVILELQINCFCDSAQWQNIE